MLVLCLVGVVLIFDRDWGGPRGFEVVLCGGMGHDVCIVCMVCACECACGCACNFAYSRKPLFWLGVYGGVFEYQ